MQRAEWGNRMRPDLYVTKRAAELAAIDAVNAKKADSFCVRPHQQRNPDRSWDVGFVAVLIKSDRPVGFA